MSELTAMQQAVLLLLREYKKKEGAFTVTAERLECEIIGDYPIKGESAPQAAGEAPEGASEDTREKLESDILNAGHDNSTEEIFGWLDRQAAITERECRRPNWEYCETCETIAKLKAEANALEEEGDELAIERDELGRKVQELEAELEAKEQLERDSAYMRLPVDADGVPIRPGDRVYGYGRKEDGMTVRFLDQHGNLMVGDTGTTSLYECLYWTAENVTHRKPGTVESLLTDFAIACEEQGYKDPRIDGLLEEYADRIRKAVEHG